MVHDQAASTVALARSILMGLDESRLETPVQTHSLKLLLNTLIELAAPRHAKPISDSANRMVLQRVSSTKETLKARDDEDERQAGLRSGRG